MFPSFLPSALRASGVVVLEAPRRFIVCSRRRHDDGNAIGIRQHESIFLHGKCKDLVKHFFDGNAMQSTPSTPPPWPTPAVVVCLAAVVTCRPPSAYATK